MLIRKRAALAAAAIAAALVSGTATSAMASPAAPAAVHPNVCVAPGTYYNTSQSSRYIGNTGTRVYGQSGGTLSITKNRTITVSGSLQTTLSADAGIVLADVSTSVGITVGLSYAVTTTTGYSWTVPSTQSTGWIEMGAHGYSISWTKGHYNSPCTWVQTGSGYMIGTTHNVQFAHS
jgi:hypothetical protein